MGVGNGNASYDGSGFVEPTELEINFQGFNASGHAQLRVVGPTDSYRVEYSEDLSTWLLLTDLPVTSGEAEVTDAGSSSESRRFYRAVKP